MPIITITLHKMMMVNENESTLQNKRNKSTIHQILEGSCEVQFWRFATFEFLQTIHQILL